VGARLLSTLLEGDSDPAIRADTAPPAAPSGDLRADVACFEPRMQDQGGHFHRLASCYESFFRERSLEMILLHHRDWEGPARPRSLGVFSLTDHTVGCEKLTSGRQLAAFERYFSSVTRHWLEATGARVAVFPTARFLTLPGYLAAVEGADTVQAAVLGVMETSPVPDCDDTGLVTRAFEEAARVIDASAKHHLVIAESAPVRDWLLARGFPESCIGVHPYVAAGRLAGSERKSGSDGDGPRFGYLGGARPVQNPGLMARYLLEAEPLPGRWSARLDLRLAAKELGLGPRRLRRRLGARGVRLLETHLEETDYDDLLRGTDVIALPYGSRYETIGSGLFLECLSAGVIPLLPARSTMRALYEELGGRAPAIDPVSVGGIEDSVSEYLRQREPLTRNAGLVRDHWLGHPWGPVAWRTALDRLLESLAPDPAD
jgi:hypothetical protein